MPEARGYSQIQILLHWSIAALVLFQLAVNEGMQRAFNHRLGGSAMDDATGAVIHMVAGIAVLALAIVRLSIRLVRGAPLAHDDKHPILNWLGYATHILLYGFIFLMPLTGAIAWFFGVELSAELHEIGRLILVPAIAFHVLGALAEHFVFRNDSLKRMLKATAD